MLVQDAKALAARWVREQGQLLPGFAGAFLHGSINWMPDDARLSPSSDVDVMVVLDGPMPAVKLGKFIYEGALLEISYIAQGELQSAEQVLGVPHLAGSFRQASVLADPHGRLAPMQAEVARQYASARWIRERCRQNEAKIARFLEGIEQNEQFHDKVSAWLFGTGGTTHVLLVAGLRNPTVRQRYLAARELLAAHGLSAFYGRLLELLGCAHLGRERAAEHLQALAAAFDAAAEVVATPVFFASDISADARPIAIGGSAELIERGDQREAVFWMVATSARCQKIFAADAPHLYDQYDRGLRALLADLGITSVDDMRRRGAEVLAFLPELRQVAETIMNAEC
jgi:hypothetical protein